MIISNILSSDWFWPMIQTIGVIITLIFIYKQIRIQTASHVVQTLSVINHRWNEDAMLRARLHASKQYLDNEYVFDGVSEHIALFMEELGTYTLINAVNEEIMWEVQSWNIEHYYCFFKQGIEDMRKRYHDDALYENIEKLFDAMTAISRQKGVMTSERGDEDLKTFAESEVQMTEAFLKLQATS